MKKSEVIEQIKQLGWDYINITTKGFFGGTAEFKKIGVGFNSSEAFVIEDDWGFLRAKDIAKGIFKDSTFDMDDTGSVEGLSILAYFDEETKQVIFDEELLARLNLNPVLTDDIRNHILAIQPVVQTVDVEISEWVASVLGN